MQMINVIALEIVPLRNTVLAVVSVAQCNKCWHQPVTRFEITDGHGDVQNWFGRDARNGSAANVLNVQSIVTKRSSNP